MRPLASRVSTVSLIALTSVAFASCGGDDADEGGAGTATTPTTAEVAALDTKKVEKAIKASIREQRDVSAKVECPELVRQAKDENFVCLVETKKFGTTRFAVVQTDDVGNVQYAAESEDAETSP